MLNNLSLSGSLIKWGTICSVLLVGCSRDEIQTYRVDKEAAPAAAPSTSTVSNELPPPHASPEKLEWTKPKGWEQKAPSAMRYASFSVVGEKGAQADFSVVTLAGEAGGVLPNINRWRNQLGLGPLSEGQLADNFVHFDVLGTKVVLVDFASTAPMGEGSSNTRMLAAILPRGPATWFFKMVGDDALVRNQKTSFTKFLKSLHFTMADRAADPAPTMPAPNVAGGGGLKWSLPSGWKEQAASGMRKGSFLVEGKQNMQADVSIISLPGEAGGVLPNINRWRGQISLPPLSDADLKKIASTVVVQGQDGLLVDMLSGGVLEKKSNKTRVLGLILVKDGQSWFFKMSGDDALVESQKTIFVNFVKSIEIPRA